MLRFPLIDQFHCINDKTVKLYGNNFKKNTQLRNIWHSLDLILMVWTTSTYLKNPRIYEPRKRWFTHTKTQKKSNLEMYIKSNFFRLSFVLDPITYEFSKKSDPTFLAKNQLTFIY
jgi:hypothetical protein